MIILDQWYYFTNDNTATINNDDTGVPKELKSDGENDSAVAGKGKRM